MVQGQELRGEEVGLQLGGEGGQQGGQHALHPPKLQGLLALLDRPRQLLALLQRPAAVVALLQRAPLECLHPPSRHVVYPPPPPYAAHRLQWRWPLYTPAPLSATRHSPTHS